MKEKKENESGPQFSYKWEWALVAKTKQNKKNHGGYKLLSVDFKTSKNVASGWK